VTARRSAAALALALVAAVVQGAFGFLTLGVRFFYGRQDPTKLNADVALFDSYASKLFAGQVPYRDYLIEYPIAALPVFVIPRIFASDSGGYGTAFGAEMLLFNAWALWLVADRVAREDGLSRVAGRLGWYTLVFAASCPLLMARFDLAPMAVAFAAAVAWEAGRPGLGGGLAGVGVLLKIFPGAAVLPALFGIRRGTLRGWLALGLTMAVGLGSWVVLGGKAVGESLGYHLERGLEVGSLYSGASIVLSRLTGASLRTATLHSSTEMVGRWPERLAPLAFPLQMAAMGMAVWMSRRRGGRDRLRYAGAALAAFVIFGKVLSPQYVAWLFPFLAVQGGRVGYWGRAVFLAAVGATTLLYPWAFARLAALDGLHILALLIVRNALLLLVWAILLFGPEDAPRTADDAP